MPNYILADQPQETREAYADYCEAKEEINETPFTFQQWAEIEIENNTALIFAF